MVQVVVGSEAKNPLFLERLPPWVILDGFIRDGRRVDVRFALTATASVQPQQMREGPIGDITRRSFLRYSITTSANDG
jgi:hypothetical protein